jgi:hypothetical protein
VSVASNRRILLLLAFLALALLAGYEARAGSAGAGLRTASCRTLSLPASSSSNERTWACLSSSEEADDAMVDDTEDPTDPQMVAGVLLRSAHAGRTEPRSPSRADLERLTSTPSELSAPVLRRRIFKKP